MVLLGLVRVGGTLASEDTAVVANVGTGDVLGRPVGNGGILVTIACGYKGNTGDSRRPTVQNFCLVVW